MHFVRPNLAVCGFHHIGSEKDFRGHGFHAQLQCTEPFDAWLRDCVEVKALPFHDGAPIPPEIFAQAQDWLAGHWDRGSRILVSCAAGASRSVTMTIVLLNCKGGASFLGAAMEVMKKIPTAYPHPLVLLSASGMSGELLTLPDLRRIYASARTPPPYPWPETLLEDSLNEILGKTGRN